MKEKKRKRLAEFLPGLLVVDLLVRLVVRSKGWGIMNSGIGLGIGLELSWWVVVLLIGFLIFWWMRSDVGVGERLMILGGMGNLLDRLGFGSVIDWIRLMFFDLWFNLGDLYIVVGLGVILVNSFLEKHEDSVGE